ncbi:FkbM family methyltransferase [Streptomyces sp. WMMB 322]|uniref:FkbM family methyltransferase n=1 Tax=Streptomyces sp. WMMB 322 TaxID=1286821 RepID=UPI0006E34CFA|nr:FkbM family methyltransferase [Streptomyces sp. WMMB 322]SCK12776.1 methyltransferase, FkbM family [Streptomyces sp. WMMB 322]
MNVDGRRLFHVLGRGYVRHAPGVLGKRALARNYLVPQLREHPVRRPARTRSGARFLVDTEDLIQRHLYLFGVWEPHLTHWLKQRLKPGDVFVDVGANVGYFSVLGSSLVGPEGTVVAIEASSTFHRQLVQQAQMNRCRNLRTVNAAVSDKDETVTFVQASSRNTGATSTVPYSGPALAEFEVDAHPLTMLLSEQEIERARVIKIDVEGAEGAAVRGLKPAFARLREDAEVVVEVTPERMRALGDSAEELLTSFTEAGFHAYRLVNDYDPGSYPSAIRRPLPPRRWRQPVSEEMDLVFSRVDAESLA